jgi:CheY-like chemotaxis protein
LTVVRRIVELHGGEIEARSAGLDRGSEFIVRLPAIPPPKDDAASVETARSDVSARVLVVEDNPDAAESLQVLLEICGHRVRIAGDGPAALREVALEPPDIALLDLGLPGMSGYDLVRLLRDDPGMKGVALVAVSGYGRDEDKERALQAGFHHHLTKPVDFTRLQALIAELASVRRQLH